MSGICANITDMKTNIQPMISLALSISPSISHPERAAKTDSRLITMDATVGSAVFCPIICNV